MSRIPGGSGVVRALRGVKKELKGALRQTHLLAAKMLSKGNYAGAQALVNVAQAMRNYAEEVESFSAKWKSLAGSAGGRATSEETTPLWSYYEMILQALSAENGRASSSNLFLRLEPIVGKALKPNDLEPMSTGRPRWQAMVKRARRHMVKEGFIEKGGGTDWRITAAGKRAAVGQGAAT